MQTKEQRSANARKMWDVMHREGRAGRGLRLPPGVRKQRLTSKLCDCGCGHLIRNRSKRFATRACQKVSDQREYIERWLRGEEPGYDSLGLVHRRIKRYLLEKHGERCIKCNWAERHEVTGKVPLTFNHKDGDFRNNKEDNIEQICPNCHSLTSNFGALNKGKGRSIEFRRSSSIGRAPLS